MQSGGEVTGRGPVLRSESGCELVHIAFRSSETGRYLFHAKYPAETVRKWEMAARIKGQTLDEFVDEALRSYFASVASGE